MQAFMPPNPNYEAQVRERVCQAKGDEDDRGLFDYYQKQHMPRSIELLSGAKGFKGMSVERGVEIDEPRIESSFVAMCHYYFDSLEDFLAAFLPHAIELQGDIANYTDIEPIIQANEAKLTQP